MPEVERPQSRNHTKHPVHLAEMRETLPGTLPDHGIGHRCFNDKVTLFFWQAYMPVDSITGIWTPNLSPKQFEIFNCSKRLTIVSGPRLCGKTTAVEHRVIRHAWFTPKARVAIFCKTIKNAKSGVWADLIETVVPEWLAANLTSQDGFDFEYTVEPKVDGATRTHFFKIRNAYGSESTVQLHSLDYDGDVESAVFGTRFSLIWFSELQHFKTREVLDSTKLQLRMPGLAYEKHQWIGDTNPPEEGPEHWAYKIWFTELEDVDHPDKDYQKQLCRIECTLDDNPFLDARQVSELKSTYRHDPEAFDRFVLGKWTFAAGHSEKHFSAQFKPRQHVIGTTDPQSEADWEYLNPTVNCQQLICGWDLGDTNHSAHIVERIVMPDGRLQWHILEELVSIAEEVTIEEFTIMFLELMDGIEERLGHPVAWKHWSDESAWRFRAGGAESMDALTVEKASNGRITLMSAQDAKKPGCVRKRVDITKQLLVENRLFVSAHCKATIAMFKNLRKGKKPTQFVLPGNVHKHPFDSLTYPIYSETLEDLAFGVEPVATTRLISRAF